MYFKLFDRVCEVRASSGPVLDHLAWVYEGCRLRPPGHAEVRLDLRGDELTGYTVSLDGTRVAAAATLPAALLLLDLELLRWPLFLNPSLLLFHAAWLAKDRRALLLVGEGGSGKSSLGYLLAARGLALGSEEVAAFAGTGRLLPFPRRILLKADNPLVPRLALKQDPRNLLAAVDGRFYVLPPQVSWAPPGFYDCTFVFLNYQAGGPGLQVALLDTLEALQLLVGAAFGLKGLSPSLFAVLVESLEPARALALTYASLEEACAFLGELAHGKVLALA